MQRTRSLRNKTAILVIKQSSKSLLKIKKKLSIELQTSTPKEYKNQASKFNKCLTPQNIVVKTAIETFSARNSGRISVKKKKEKNTTSLAIADIKRQFIRLTYLEKLEEVCNLFKKVRQLSQIHGYFYVTLAMLKFDAKLRPRASILIHPDQRSTKPIHPIKKSSKFQCQLECASELKNLIRSLIPTFDFGDGKTLSNIVAYTQSTKNGLFYRRKTSQLSTPYIQIKTQPTTLKYELKLQSQLLDFQVNPKNKTNSGWLKKQYISDNQKYFNQDGVFINYKNQSIQHIQDTKSKLLESFRSLNNFGLKQRAQLSNLTNVKINNMPKNTTNARFVRKASMTSNIEQQRKRNIKDYLTSTFSHISPAFIAQNGQKNPISPCSSCLIPSSPIKTKEEDPQKQPQKQTKSPLINSVKSSEVKKSALLGSSLANRKLMSMSIEMQSQINKLFIDECHLLNNFYGDQQIQRRNIKNSILSKVAQEFDDLF